MSDAATAAEPATSGRAGPRDPGLITAAARTSSRRRRRRLPPGRTGARPRGASPGASRGRPHPATEEPRLPGDPGGGPRDTSSICLLLRPPAPRRAPRRAFRGRVSLGDPMLYSSYQHLHRALEAISGARHPRRPQRHRRRGRAGPPLGRGRRHPVDPPGHRRPRAPCRRRGGRRLPGDHEARRPRRRSPRRPARDRDARPRPGGRPRNDGRRLDGAACRRRRRRRPVLLRRGRGCCA